MNQRGFSSILLGTGLSFVMTGCGNQPPASTSPRDPDAFQKPPFERVAHQPAASREILQRTDIPSSFQINIINAAYTNPFFRKVLYTTTRSQIAMMSLETGKTLGPEVRGSDQVIVFVGGEGEFQVRDHRGRVQSGELLAVPANAEHTITNTGAVALKFYVIYAPPEHPPATAQRTQAK